LNATFLLRRDVRDDFEFRLSSPELHSKALEYLQQCTVNSWTKLDEYFVLVDDTPAHYASVVTNPLRKWKYFEHTWKDASQWKDAADPSSWLCNGEKALQSIWKEYKDLPINLEAVSGARKRKRSPSPDEYERATNMTLLYGGDDDDGDELAKWIKQKPFMLPQGITLPEYWLSRLKSDKTYRLARLGWIWFQFQLCRAIVRGCFLRESS
jgi:hypothetical protein